ncbi:MAG: Holliday junction branch migration protein RuvA [Beggiatoa sp. IS2]|nr:MAG: Holliday junction branch migration protein RuvA [Beggiatoa sp. IS2]
MIGRLRGVLLEKQPPRLVLEVQGVGYELEAPMSTFYQLPELNSEVRLFTHLNVREDALILYGFSSEAERQLFRILLRVNGVGPKLALSILSAMELTTFVQCIQSNDMMRLTRIPGVGKKTAERLILEIRDRLDDVKTLPGMVPVSSPLAQGVTSAVDDAISALVALGYKPQEASRWVHAIAEDGLTSETLIRRALQSAL